MHENVFFPFNEETEHTWDNRIFLMEINYLGVIYNTKLERKFLHTHQFCSYHKAQLCASLSVTKSAALGS